ncbi:uncharacterized protein LOC106461053 [Limulus polyphemus]|uniref:Uncharacterized protein LOC106461053 n=1 Tax=Limulus polyphemus TaxID=6850 RepID=A0ABM1B7C9_LIMPO|nr:uncharacterized protein LOC106461053 [Limulus polyphemus]
MSTSLSVDASTTPNSSSYKMNGGVSPRSNLNLKSLSGSKPSVIRLSPTDFINSDNGPEKPLLNLFQGSIQPVSQLFFSSKPPPKPTIPLQEKGTYQTLAALALVCLLSLLMSFLATLFLDKLGSFTYDFLDGVIRTNEYVLVYQVSVALSTLTISLNVCCVFICCLQFLFTIKLLKTSQEVDRTASYLRRTSLTRTIAIGGFFISIPVFCTGIILFTFICFHESPAIVTSVVIGLCIMFCGAASIHNMYLWQGISSGCQPSTRKLHESGLGPDLTAHVNELSTLV